MRGVFMAQCSAVLPALSVSCISQSYLQYMVRDMVALLVSHDVIPEQYFHDLCSCQKGSPYERCVLSMVTNIQISMLVE